MASSSSSYYVVVLVTKGGEWSHILCLFCSRVNGCYFSSSSSMGEEYVAEEEELYSVRRTSHQPPSKWRRGKKGRMRKSSLTNFERVRRPSRGIFIPAARETSETFLGEDESEIIIKFMGFRRSKFSLLHRVGWSFLVVHRMDRS